MSNEITIGYIVANRTPQGIGKIIGGIGHILPHLKFMAIKSIDDLYRIILAPQLIRLDYVCIDIEQIYGSAGISHGKAQIVTLNTLMAATGSDTKILGIVGEDSSADMVRELSSVVAGFCIKFGDQWKFIDIVADVGKFSRGDLSMPALVKQLLIENPRKQRTLVVSPQGMGSNPKVASMHSRLGAEHNIEYFTAPSLSWIYNFLNDPAFPVDTIAIDLDYLYGIRGGGAIIKVQTLLTLIDSLEYLENGTYVPRTVSILGGVSLKTDTKIIRDFVSIKGVAGIFPRGPEFTEDEKREAMKAYTHKEFHIPRRIREKLSARSGQRRSSATISLTAREGQIYNIIVERGASNKHIARMLGVSEPTVKMHVGKILKKYGLRNRTQLVSFKKSTEV